MDTFFQTSFYRGCTNLNFLNNVWAFQLLHISINTCIHCLFWRGGIVVSDYGFNFHLSDYWWFCTTFHLFTRNLVILFCELVYILVYFLWKSFKLLLSYLPDYVIGSMDSCDGDYIYILYYIISIYLSISHIFSMPVACIFTHSVLWFDRKYLISFNLLYFPSESL